MTPVLGLGDLGWGAGVTLAAFALLAALFVLSVVATWRALRTRQWGWPAVIVVSWPFGLVWLVGGLFLFGVDRPARRRAG